MIITKEKLLNDIKDLYLKEGKENIISKINSIITNL